MRENCVQLDLNILGKMFTVYKSDTEYNYWLKPGPALDAKEQLKPKDPKFKIQIVQTCNFGFVNIFKISDFFCSEMQTIVYYNMALVSKVKTQKL